MNELKWVRKKGETCLSLSLSVPNYIWPEQRLKKVHSVDSYITANFVGKAENCFEA